MNLKRLELSGFKSFAQPTTFEFPAHVTAIVGPNGSGKSNVVESVRWALGEQSMKSLRGKKGEDLIWNGSAGVARMGKASVALVFDNTDGRIPLDFQEVTIARKIFRDGVNEYYLNGSPVRLKDVVELVARMGLGEAKHNIINQGEVDRMLLSSARDRRDMLEEALGLRVYRIKKNEAERKFEQTLQNMAQVEALMHEIAPHLRFLRSQAEKAEKREGIEQECKQLEKIYFAKEYREIGAQKQKLGERLSPLTAVGERARKEIEKILGEIAAAEKALEAMGARTQEEKKILALEARRRECERELGRMEARFEIEKEELSRPKLRAVDTRYIEDEIRGLLEEVKNVLENEDNLETIKSRLFVFVEDMEQLLAQIRKGSVDEKKAGESAAMRDCSRAIAELEKEIGALGKEIETYQSARREEREKSRAAQQNVRELDIALRAKQEEERDLSLQRERLKFEEERLKLREEAFAGELAQAGIREEDIREASHDGYESMASEELKRRIERMRLRLEEIGGIDGAVVNEYRETEARHSFLSKELTDLKGASSSLKELIRELEEHMKNDFHAGFAKIKEEFHNYFRIIFGGGKASLHLVSDKRQATSDTEDSERTVEDDDEEQKTEEGIEIFVDLPRKRVKGLAMLSGGERALTSVALLFAITAVNPPPFLVLDETDAALDEANSTRYAAILRELAKKTQLILVTHNRETMKCAGVLYGVTMGDDGVSRLLSLKFEDAQTYTNR